MEVIRPCSNQHVPFNDEFGLLATLSLAAAIRSADGNLFILFLGGVTLSYPDVPIACLEHHGYLPDVTDEGNALESSAKDPE